jgi:hypothetical protein
VNLVLKQTESEQVRFKAILRDVNGLLVRGVAKHDHHDQADDQRNCDDDSGWDIDS